jgi:hypothetical protein
VNARCEWKYLIDEATARWVRERAAIWMQPDTMGGASYQVTSLYLDRWDWVLARQTLEGVRERFKLRLRYYGDTPTQVFAEVKERVGHSIAKARSLMAPIPALALATNAYLADVAAVAVSGRNPDQRFRQRAEQVDAQPRLWVRYQREAWTSPWGDDVRLTFDRELEVQIPDTGAAFLPGPSFNHVTLERPVILELKFNGAFPLWMRQIAEGGGLRRQAVSKYALGALEVGGIPWAAIRGGPWTPG